MGGTTVHTRRRNVDALTSADARAARQPTRTRQTWQSTALQPPRRRPAGRRRQRPRHRPPPPPPRSLRSAMPGLESGRI